jgi:hypothetical protein
VFNSNILFFSSTGKTAFKDWSVAACIQYNYCARSKYPEELYATVAGEFLRDPAIEVLQAIRSSPAQEDHSNYCKPMLIPIRNLQLNWSHSAINLLEFTINVGRFKVRDIPLLHFHLDDTISLLLEQGDLSLIYHYGLLSVLLNIMTDFIARKFDRLKANYREMEIRNDRLADASLRILKARYILLRDLLEQDFLHREAPGVLFDWSYLEKARDFRVIKAFQSLLDCLVAVARSHILSFDRRETACVAVHSVAAFARIDWIQIFPFALGAASVQC